MGHFGVGTRGDPVSTGVSYDSRRVWDTTDFLDDNDPADDQDTVGDTGESEENENPGDESGEDEENAGKPEWELVSDITTSEFLGDDLKVTATIINSGDGNGTVTVTLENEETDDETTIDVEADSSQDVEFETTLPSEEGSIKYQVSATESDEVVAKEDIVVNVKQRVPEWKLSIDVETDGEFRDALHANVNVENIGSADGTVNLSFVKKETLDEAVVDVDSNSSELVSFEATLPAEQESIEYLVKLSEDNEVVTEERVVVDVKSPYPSSDYVVAEDGSGDYEQLTDAYRIADDGDVLKVKSGEYSYQPDVHQDAEIPASWTPYEIEKSLTIVGTGPDETTITVLQPDEEDELQFSSSVDLQYMNLTLDVEDGTEFYSIGGTSTVEVQDSVLLDVFGSSSYFEGSGVEIDVSPAGKLDLEDSRLKHDSQLREVRLVDSVVEGHLAASEVNHLETTTLESGLEITSQDSGISSPNIVDCTIKANNDGIAIEISSSTQHGNNLDTDVLRSRIEGQIAATGANEYDDNVNLRRVIGCVFNASDVDIDEFTNGYGAKTFAGNAFVGASLSVENDDVAVYDDDVGLGNYYSEWDGANDDSGDNISDLPKPIPGGAGLTDQYPLMTDNLDAYESEIEDIV